MRVIVVRMDTMQRYIGRSSTAFLHRPTSKQKAVRSAEDVLSLLAPQARRSRVPAGAAGPGSVEAEAGGGDSSGDSPL